MTIPAGCAKNPFCGNTIRKLTGSLSNLSGVAEIALENAVFRDPATTVTQDLGQSAGGKVITLAHPETNVSIVGISAFFN
ncbi:MAG: hypothetical protein R3C26_01570 [Calditrichia bacterium]